MGCVGIVLPNHFTGIAGPFCGGSYRDAGLQPAADCDMSQVVGPVAVFHQAGGMELVDLLAEVGLECIAHETGLTGREIWC